MKYDVHLSLDTETGTIKLVSLDLSGSVAPPPVTEPPPPPPQPSPTGTLTQTLAVTLSEPVTVGDSIPVAATLQNNTDTTVVIKDFVIAVRPPGASHTSGPFDKDIASGSETLIPGHVFAISDYFTPDSPGTWSVYSTYCDDAGVWHDNVSQEVAITVNSKPAPTPGPAPDSPPVVTPDPTPTPTPGSPSTFTNPLGKAILGSQGWGANWGGGYPLLADGSLNPAYIQDYKNFNYGVVRFMDFVPANSSKVATWAQRDNKAEPQAIPIERMVELCNALDADMWFCIPHKADDDYVKQLATLINSTLKPNLRLYVEFSNEIWNIFGSFQQGKDANRLGAALGLPGMNEYYQGPAYAMHRVLQMFDIIEGVVGKAAMGSRVMRVWAHSGNLNFTTNALANVYMSSTWNPTGQKFDMLACAPYVGNGANGAAETVAHWNAEVDSLIKGQIAVTKVMAQQYKIPYQGMYEFGQHHLQGATDFATNPIAYTCYTDMLNKYMATMNGPCCLYASHGTWPKAGAANSGAWGIITSVGASPDSSHKARAVRDWNRNK